VRWLASSGQVLKDAEGYPAHLIGTITDITQRKQLEEKLRHTTESLNIAQAAAGLATFDFNFGANSRICSDNFHALLGIPPATIIYKSVGCRECRNTGFFGRHAIFEWMDSNEEIRQLILKNASSDQIRDAARRDGMSSLADDGWRLVAAGVTTVEEVLSVTTAKEIEMATQVHTGPSAATLAVAK